MPSHMPSRLASPDPTTHERLSRWAARYIWWKSPEEAVRCPARIVAQVMDVGDYADVQEMVEALDEDVLRDVIASAEAGWFRERSWHYWHYRLGLVAPGDRVPSLPRRVMS